MQKVRDSSGMYICIDCSYNTVRKSQYDRHILTAKHKRQQSSTNGQRNIVPNYICSCGREYKERTGLWKHKKKCDRATEPNVDECLEEPSPNTAELLVMFKDMLAKMEQKDKQMAGLQATMKEMIPKIGNNNTINSNNKFNLQMFLNTDCKDAINLTDFIKTIQLEMNDMLHIGNTGYVEGISDIFIGALNKLQITERPIHCTDVRRDTVYIKENDHWDKSDAENPVLRKAIHHIDSQNQHLLPKWMEENPDSQHLDTPENIQLMKMFANSLGQGEEQSKLTKKIMKKILPRVALSKESAIQE
jgi:hypothetical protein